jgi:cytochrome c peroxidase
MRLGIVGCLILTCCCGVSVQSLVLDEVPIPEENPVTESKRILGKILFWEEQLSSDNSVACGTCHKPGAGGADDRSARHPGPDLNFDTGNETLGSPGVPLYSANQTLEKHPNFGFAPQVTRRVSQSILTSMYADALFWDGRARDNLVDPLTEEVVIASGAALENQALVPILSSTEMGHITRTWNQVTEKLEASTPLTLAQNLPTDIQNILQDDPGYSELFMQAFGDPAITPVRIAMAIATYERTLVPDQTPFDSYVQGNTSAMTTDQIAGWELFQDSVCSHCHVPPLFTDNTFARTGLRTRFDDNGLQVFTKNTDDFGLFKIPSLRNVGLRQALTHVGTITSVQDAIDFYNAGTSDTGHTIFTDGLSTVPDPDNPENNIRIDEIDFFSTEPDKQDQVVDFLSNALIDPRVATESFPFDRPVLGSDTAISDTVSTDEAIVTARVKTKTIINHSLTLDSVINRSDSVSINQEITLDPADIGKSGVFYLVIKYNNSLYQRNSDWGFKLWNGSLDTLLPLSEINSLSATESISVVENLSGLAGNFLVYTGYSTGGRLVYSNSPYQFIIE